MKIKNKNFIIPLVLYPFDIMFSIGQTDEELEKILKRALPPGTEWPDKLFNIPSKIHARTCMTDKGNTIIRFMKVTYLENGVIAHEIFHAVSNIMKILQMPLHNKNEEAYAYLLGYIVKQFYEHL